MIQRFAYRTVTLFALFISISAFAGSPVWKVSKGDNHLYLGGTIHLLAHSDYPLPAQFDKAYSEASSLVMETDLATIQSPAYMGKMMKIMTFTDGKTLQSVLKPETYTALNNYFQAKNLPSANFASFTPIGVGLTIAVVEMQKLGMTPEAGVDQFYALKARNDGKALGQLETPDEHLSFIAAMGTGKEDELILKTLNDIEEMPKTMADLKAAWRTGDNKKLEKMAIDEMKTEFPQVYDVLLTNRNKAWMPKIEDMLKDKDIELVLVGALHLPGKDGLIHMLKKKGYKVENL